MKTQCTGVVVVPITAVAIVCRYPLLAPYSIYIYILIARVFFDVKNVEENSCIAQIKEIKKIQFTSNNKTDYKVSAEVTTMKVQAKTVPSTIKYTRRNKM